MKVVMTGAAGGVATMLRPHLRQHVTSLVLSDLQDIDDLREGETSCPADLTDAGGMQALLKGADALIHFGGQSVERPWEEILNANIIGLYNIYEAARLQGCNRIIFATSNHVVGFYRRQQTINHEVPLRPDSRYGVSKAFGEALGRMYADKHGLRILNIRIGNVAEKPMDIRRLSIWISPRDLCQLIQIGLAHPDLHFDVVYGMSNNARAWWDNSHAHSLGYRPEDRAEDFADFAHEQGADRPEDPITAQFQGGGFSRLEFDSDAQRID